MDDVQQLRLSVRTARPQDGVAVIALGGECDLYDAHRVEAALEAAAVSANLIVLDLSELRFVDSTFLHVLLKGQRSVDAARADLVLVAPSREVRRALATTGLDARFDIRARRDPDVDGDDAPFASPASAPSTL